jgi:uncharacterized protein YrrD
MLTSFSELKGQSIQATDGEIGSVHDVMFEGDCGAVRYLVVDTGGWLFGRKVLVSVYALNESASPGILSVDMTKEAIKDGPTLESEEPFRRDVQMAYHDYYSWPYYWMQGGLRDGPLGVAEPVAKVSAAPLPADSMSPPDPGPWGDVEPLFSTRRVIGFDVLSHDDAMPDRGNKVGKVDELVFDTDGWHVRFIVVDRGHQDVTLLPVRWIEMIDWDEKDLRLLVGDGVIAGGPSYGGAVSIAGDNGDEVERYFDSAGPEGLRRDVVKTGAAYETPVRGGS